MVISHFHVITRRALARRSNLPMICLLLFREDCFAHLRAGVAQYLRTLGNSIRLFADIFNCTRHHECLLRQVVAFPIENFAEAAHGFFEWDIASINAGEALSNKEWLREEALDLSGTRHN